jgi:glycosyltransferase involved in cell wall biosynthesis
MRIGLITYPMETNPTGIGVHVKNMVQNIIRLDQANTYSLLHFTPSSNPIYRNREIFYRRYPFLPVMFADSWYLYENQSRFDIVHRFSPGGFICQTKTKIVITAHDLFLFKNYPFNKKTRNYLARHFIRSSLQRAHAVIAVSQYTKEELVNTFGLSREKLHVIHNAPGVTPLRNENSRNSILSKYGIDYDYILFVSTIEPRKNLLGLVKAFESLREQHNISEHLVVVGRKGWDFTETISYIRRSRHCDWIHLVGFVPDSDLAGFYQNAHLFVYPSFMEGFGIPPLEAMRCGCPTLTSNTSALPEVMRYPEMMFNPENINEIAYKCNRILNDTNFRLDNLAKGAENVKRFSWKASAQKLIRIYDSL